MYELLEATLIVLLPFVFSSSFFSSYSVLFSSNSWLFGTFYRKASLHFKCHNSWKTYLFQLKLSDIANYTKMNFFFLSEDAIMNWLGFVLEASISTFCVKIVYSDIIKGTIMEFSSHIFDRHMFFLSFLEFNV